MCGSLRATSKARMGFLTPVTLAIQPTTSRPSSVMPRFANAWLRSVTSNALTPGGMFTYWALVPIPFSANSSPTRLPTVTSVVVFFARYLSIKVMILVLKPENSGSSNKWPWKVWTTGICCLRALVIKPALKVWEWIMSGLNSLIIVCNCL